MPSKILALHRFIEENRRYNLELQKNVLTNWINPYNSTPQKAYSLLLNVYQTQSRPGLDNAKDFFEGIYYSKRALSSFESFAKYLGATTCDYHSLSSSLSIVPGWGKKTSALFVKMLYQLAHHKELRRLLFWNDSPKLKTNDNINLPVDQVILDIFRYIDKSKNSFHKINVFLKTEFGQNNLETWDDLWFWGFFNQKGTGSDRKLTFNYGKYWINSYTNKHPNIINEIKDKSKKFVDILKSNKWK